MFEALSAAEATLEGVISLEMMLGDGDGSMAQKSPLFWVPGLFSRSKKL